MYINTNMNPILFSNNLSIDYFKKLELIQSPESNNMITVEYNLYKIDIEDLFKNIIINNTRNKYIIVDIIKNFIKSSNKKYYINNNIIYLLLQILHDNSTNQKEKEEIKNQINDFIKKTGNTYIDFINLIKPITKILLLE